MNRALKLLHASQPIEELSSIVEQDISDLERKYRHVTVYITTTVAYQFM